MTRQLDLTFDPERDGPALDQARAMERRASLPATIRFGTEDWRHPQWAQRVWDGPRDVEQLEERGLTEYAAHHRFDALMINADREPISEQTLRRYAGQLPSEFSVMLHAPSLVTAPRLSRSGGFDVAHVQTNRHFLDPDWFYAEVAQPGAAAFGARLRAVVLTLPDDLGSSGMSTDGFAFRLERLLEGLPPQLPIAIELRDGDFLSLDYTRVLATHGAEHVFTSAPRMPVFSEQMRWAPGHSALIRLADPPQPQYADRGLRDEAVADLVATRSTQPHAEPSATVIVDPSATDDPLADIDHLVEAILNRLG